MSDALRGQRVLVTSVAGIHGFVGGRLVEMLSRWNEVTIRTFMADFNEAPRVARFPIEMVRGDMTDPAAVERAVAGCDIVFNTSHDFERAEINVEAAKILARACLNNGVKRLVHLSSAGVYEPFHDAVVKEDALMWPCDVDWVKSKRAVEAELLRFHGDQGLSLVIIQPTHVYGPEAHNGTLRPVHHMQRGKVVIPDREEGLCNTVYVDDVVQGMLLAATTDGIDGERFIVTGPTPMTWREFYGAFERMIGVDGVSLRPPVEMWEKGLPRRLAGVARMAIRLKDVPPLKQLKTRLSEQQVRSLQGIAARRSSTRLYYPDRLSLRLYMAKSRVSYDKAARMLGYEPRFDFERGMDLTERYLRWSNLI